MYHSTCCIANFELELLGFGLFHLNELVLGFGLFHLNYLLSGLAQCF